MTHPIPLAKSLLQLTLTSALSIYGLSRSYANITRLQQYERASEKAAEWSATAAQRLHKTRTTQTSGSISLLVSLITPIVAISSDDAVYLVSAAAVNVAILLLARWHMAAFWNEREQTRVPFVQKFNDAVRGSEKVVEILGLLGAAWAVTGLGWGFMGKGWL